ncbi:RteC protein [Mucilaginibacter gracilis]|uniref:RteC protein n=1 Tax=Mucilaginibacter gracilis TaxID=423350 RepID=A0A495IW23_9SPHI|nr:RteC domain-containing protein [Mucilaginibacter gracilis]RKR80693.1 RteC protein [Mucilaginibacter gracilis]
METVIELYEQLKRKLMDIELTATNILELAKLSYQAVETSMIQLKAFVITYTFKDTAEEIYFFRELKPGFYSRMIYYIRLFEIETNKPDGSDRAQRKYFKKKLGGIKTYSEENIPFYKYYRSGARHMDIAYFTRDKFDILIGIDVSYFDCDPAFCTSHDYKVAMLLANEQLIAYLNKALQKLSGQYSDSKINVLEDLGLNWAETKTAFVELMYGLQSLGAFYNVKTKAKADINDIARFFEVVLGIDLGNYYRLYYDIRLRKKEPTTFIDKLKQSLIKRMNETDDR